MKSRAMVMISKKITTILPILPLHGIRSVANEYEIVGKTEPCEKR